MFHLQQCKLCNTSYQYGSSTNSNKGNKKSSTQEQHLPRILRCGHTFCDRCMQGKLLSTTEDDSHEIICPLQSCQAKTPLPDNDVKTLQVNKYIVGSLAVANTLRNQHAQRLLQLLERKPSEHRLPQTGVKQEKCLNCQEAVAVLQCEKCDDAMLCEPCNALVHKSRVLASHKPRPLEDKSGLQTVATLDMLRMSEECPEHPERRREYFCTDCSAAICADCGVLGSHSGHSLERLEDRNRELKPALVKIQERVNKALGLVHDSKKRLYSEKSCGGSGDGGAANPAMERIADVFLELHSMLQIKQHEIEEKVFLATGNNTHLLRSIDEQLAVTKRQFELLAFELERVLSNSAFESCHDFSLINTTAQEVLKMPCHLLVNDLCADVDIDVNEELLSGLSNLVTVSVQSPVRTRYELTSIANVSEEVLESCPLATAPSPQRSLSDGPAETVYSVNCISVVACGSDADAAGGRHRALSPASSQGSYSRQSSHHSISNYDYPPTQRPPSLDPYAQRARAPKLPTQHQPFYEDDINNIPSFGETTSQSSFGSQLDRGSLSSLTSPNYHTSGCDGYDVNPSFDRGVHYGSHPPHFVHDYTHGNRAMQPQAHRGGSNFENFEQSARQYKAYQAQQQQQQQQQQQEFRSRDMRLQDPRYQHSGDFVVYREGGPVHHPQTRMPRSPGRPQENFQHKPKMTAVGRGRGAPAPVFAPGPSSASQYQKKLFMRPSPPITESSSAVFVSHIESPGCFYVQQPQRLKALKKLQLRFDEHCSNMPPLTDLHNVKYLFARTNGVWRRGETKKILDRSVQIFFPDYGFTATVKSNDLRSTTGSLLSLPQVATKCYLQGIQPADGSNDWDPLSSDNMKEVLSYANNITLHKLETPLDEEDHLAVDLLMRDHNSKALLSMRDYLVFIERAVWDSPTLPYILDNKVLNQTFLKPVPLCQGAYVLLFITHVVNPQEIYAQIVNRKLDGEPASDADAELIQLEFIMRTMNEKYSAKCSTLVHKVLFPKPGDAVAASYNNEWFRAQIMALQPGHVKVKYVDYGNVEIVLADQIRVLPREFRELPMQAVRMSIHGTSPASENGKWSKKVCEGLTQMCVEKHCKAKIITGAKSPEGLQIIMTMNDTGENVGDVLVKNGLANRSVDEVTEDEGVECRCTHAESPGEIYMQPVHLSERVAQLAAELNRLMAGSEEAAEEAADDQKLEWRVDDNCAVKRAKNWVRAIIEEVTANSRCKLRLIDTGHLMSTPLVSLRALPDTDLTSCPAMTTLTSIAGLVPAGGSKTWGPTSKDTLKELLDDCESCKVVPKGQAKEVLPCDIMLPEEIPGKIKGLPGEIVYVSVKERLLDHGVALRGELLSIEPSPQKTTTTTQPLVKNIVVGQLTNARVAMEDKAESNPAVEGGEHQPPHSPARMSPAPQAASPTDATYESPATKESPARPPNSSVGVSQLDSTEIVRSSNSSTIDKSSNASVKDISSATNDRPSHSGTTNWPPYSHATDRLSDTSTTDEPSHVYAMDMSSLSHIPNRPSMAGARRMRKSPGGTIRSNVIEPSMAPAADATGELLKAAADALTSSTDMQPKSSSDWHERIESSGSSSDVPTPELCRQLDDLVGKPNINQ